MGDAGCVGAFIAGQIDHKRRNLFGQADAANGLAGDERLGAAS